MMCMQHHPGASNAVSIPQKKDNTIAIIVSYALLACLMAYVMFGGDEPPKPVVVAPKVEINDVEPEPKIVLNPVPSSIVASEPLWINPPEDVNMDVTEEMKVKLLLTNHNSYPVTGIIVRFTFHDLLDNELQGALEKTFDEIVDASGQLSFADVVLGEYPTDTMSVKAEVLAVSAAQ